jgi:hypothetical protein
MAPYLSVGGRMVGAGETTGHDNILTFGNEYECENERRM